jgi:hypothetical protein
MLRVVILARKAVLQAATEMKEKEVFIKKFSHSANSASAGVKEVEIHEVLTFNGWISP